jgi:subtilisin family serine protease
MRKFVLLCLFIFVVINLQAQSSGTKSATEVKYYNWFNLDPKFDKTAGVGTEKAYQTILKDKKSVPIIVAVIDGGTDVNHEDLKSKIWVNKNEIPGNGIDDDKNGYVDDIHGWNFLGSIVEENVETTRLYRKLNPKYSGKTANQVSDTTEFSLYLKVKEKFTHEFAKTEEEYNSMMSLEEQIGFADRAIKAELQKDNYTLDEVKKLKPIAETKLYYAQKLYVAVFGNGTTKEDFDEYFKYITNKYKYNYNLDFEPRKAVGDNPDIIDGLPYGNNDVVGGRPDHGTFVAGVIAADRYNNIGMLGIADNVQIMVLRVVPDGDERDKDIALAIRYAVDNGAKVLNWSFGKTFSAQKNLVDQAVKYAEQKGVLIVHAAGNDAEDNDKVEHFPINKEVSGKKLVDNWITVGASASKLDKTLPGSFSNYGQTQVDIFAPGVRIYSCDPFNKYKVADGTSFAAPVVSGIAATIWSYYPQLTVNQVKEIILKSGTNLARKKVILPKETPGKAVKVRFGTLSATGKVANLYNAMVLAAQYEKKANK